MREGKGGKKWMIERGIRRRGAYLGLVVLGHVGVTGGLLGLGLLLEEVLPVLGEGGVVLELQLEAPGGDVFPQRKRHQRKHLRADHGVLQALRATIAGGGWSVNL
eukprot:1177910-Prorocentrum_minimum.AAC.6